MNQVYFASAHVDRLDYSDTLPARFQRLLQKADFEKRFKNKRVAIKMHVGGGIGFYTIHPLFVKLLVDEVKSAGGNPFLTDGSFSTDNARVRGYTYEVVGARVVGAGGEHDKYYYEKDTDVPGLPKVEICGNIVDADAMIVFSHGKGHGHTGFGGAIKNIGMGCVSCRTRGHIHALSGKHFEWDSERCVHCGQCINGCPTGAIKFNDKDELTIDSHYCRYCMHCVISCSHDALKMDQPLEKFKSFQAGMSAAVKQTLASFEPSSTVFINVMMNITPLCDCWGFSTPPLVPDIGIFAGENIVPVEKASIDSIKTENLIYSNIPNQLLPLGDEGHLFQRIHGKDPYEQIRQAEIAGLGSPEYDLVEIP